MIDTTKLRDLAKMTPEQNTDYERLKQAAASVWFAGNMYIGPSMRELMRFFGEYKRLSPEYEQPATAPAGYKVVPDALRKLCKSAAPGPWTQWEGRGWVHAGTPEASATCYLAGIYGQICRTDCGDFSDAQEIKNAEYIAAANPATVLALLDELDRLRAIEAAARNLAKVKGRHNSEIAMNQLLEALK